MTADEKSRSCSLLNTMKASLKRNEKPWLSPASKVGTRPLKEILETKGSGAIPPVADVVGGARCVADQASRDGSYWDQTRFPRF